MSSEPIPEGTNVIELRPGAAEVPAPEPEYPDTAEAVRRPVIPEALHRANLRGTVAYQAGLRWHQLRYHGLRAPFYVVTYVWHALRGGARLSGRVLAWWHWTEGWALESLAVAAGRPGHHEAMRAHVEGKKTRAARGRIVAACAAVALAAVVLMALFSPWWGWALAGVALVLALARHGHPEGRPVIRPAVVAPVYQVPDPVVITRALGALGIAGINEAIRDGRGISFVSDVHRDGPGLGMRPRPAARRHRRADHRPPRPARLRAAPPAVGDLARGGAARARGQAAAVGRVLGPLQGQARRRGRCCAPGRPTCSARSRSAPTRGCARSACRCSRSTG